LVDHRGASDETVVETLMIPFPMIVLEEFGECPSEVPLAEWNHSIETFLFDRSYETLCVRIRIRRLERCLHDAETSLVQQPSHTSAPLLIPIADQHAVADQRTVIGPSPSGPLGP
jgi:hypothetical protein